MVLRGNKLLRLIDRYLGIPLCFLLGGADKFLKKLIPIQEQPIHNILLIKLVAIGDTILLIPVLRALKNKFPQARILVIASPVNRMVLMKCPYIDGVIVLEVDRYLKKPWLFIDFLVSIRQKRWDLVLDFEQRSRISPLLAWISGGRRKIGFRTERQYHHYLYDICINHQRRRHELECFFDLVKPLGVDSQDKSLEFWFSEEDKKKAQRILSDAKVESDDSIVLLHPGVPQHGWQRTWPEEKFAQLGDIIRKKYGAKIFVSRGKGEERNTRKVAGLMAYPAFILPDLSLRELAAFLSCCHLLVCGNTGIMHLACAVGTPVVALHGPTDPLRWGPLGRKSVVVKSNLPCSPCLYLGFEYDCQTRHCMETIEVKDVVDAVEQIFVK